MFAVEVRDHVMIAHSFAEDLDAEGLVVDIGLATEALAAALAPLKYKNLDEIPEFAGKFTTTEFLCRHLFEALAPVAMNSPSVLW